LNDSSKRSSLISARTLTNSSSVGAYPIASFAYALAYEDTPDAVKGEAVAAFLWWAIHDGQKILSALHYAPLPEGVVTKAEGLLKAFHSGGKRLL
jgi:phosphate transport system substrate-binding protein